jgi:hypothetical protein
LLDKTVVLSLLLAALPAVGQERRAEPPIALYTSFQQAVPATVLQALHDELDGLLEPSMLHLEWRPLSGVSGSEIASELAVVKFMGRCDVEGLGMKTGNPGPLGWTHMSDGVILPFADVDCDRIRVFVQKELMFRHMPEREEIFGRALARVLAHELFHIFTQTTHHGSDGVGKSAFTVQDLLTDDFQFHGREAGMLKLIAIRTNPSGSEHPGTTPTSLGAPL